MSWKMNEEKLLCFMLVEDDLAKTLSTTAGPAYWRCFIVQNRSTGIVEAKIRFRYSSGKRSWIKVRSPIADKTVAEQVAVLRIGIETALLKGAKNAGSEEISAKVKAAIRCFYPPNDEGNPESTIAWLLERDLIEVSTISTGEEKDAS